MPLTQANAFKGGNFLTGNLKGEHLKSLIGLLKISFYPHCAAVLAPQWYLGYKSDNPFNCGYQNNDLLKKKIGFWPKVAQIPTKSSGK